ncbi:metallophosphoesterase family protein [Roseivivax sp. CAU 1753]
MIFAMGDIHGQRAELERALDTIAQDPAHGAPVVFLGDYSDRGPDSRGVLDILIAGQGGGADWTCLMGNHDDLMLDFLTGPAPRSQRDAFWLSDMAGGRATVRSYGVDTDTRRPIADIHADFRAAVPAAHLAFLHGLRLSFETEAQFFCHAGICPGVPFDAQTKRDLIWIREPFLSATGDHGKLVVHGHTAIERPCHYGNRINLDGGAGYGRPLRPVLLDRHAAFALENGSRKAL